MALTSILNANKALAKLTIIPFAVKEKSGVSISSWTPAGLPFVAMYNPTTFSTSHSQDMVKKYRTDGLAGLLDIKNTENKTMTIDILLDATGASPGAGFVGSALSKVSKIVGGVDVLVAAFFLTTQTPNPVTHKPNVLRIIWGAGLFFECTMQSASVTYNLFSRTGRPLRATIKAVFVENPTLSSIAKIKNFFSSPDVTKTYVVKAGDTLYNLAKDEYGDESFYLEIANANDLKNYRKLVPGQVLLFPPINKDVE